MSLCAGVLLLAGCSGEVAGGDGAGSGTGSGAPAGAAGGSQGTPAGTGNSVASGGSGAGTSSSAGSSGSAASGASGTGLPADCADQAAIQPGRAPLRRLTIFEYNNSVEQLFGDDSRPASSLPSELSGNGFGNDADHQPIPPVLAEGYMNIAAGVAERATATPAALAKLAPCAASVTTETQASCGRTVIETLLPKIYRRPLSAPELDEHQALFADLLPDHGFPSAVAAVIEAALQAPDFLYRLEFGAPDPANPALERPTGPEMATRLSYFFLGGPPDEELTLAAQSGELLTDAGVLAQARRLVETPKARAVVAYFFENLLPLANLTDLARDPVEYPTFSPAVGALLQQETRTFLEREVWEGSGTWPGILTAPYTYMNQQLAEYYGVSGVTGNAFVKVELDTTQRLGLLTQGAIMAGTTTTNFTNPVLRGAFLLRQVLCREIHLPDDPAILAQVTTPDPYSGATARERFTQHAANPLCRGCHSQLDPLGLALENYDAVGLFRTTENGVTIDASGEVPDMPDGAASGPVELVQKLAQNPEVHACFASKWLDYAYGQTLHAHVPDDQCAREQLAASFRASGFDIKQLLVELTQTDGFLYLGARK